MKDKIRKIIENQIVTIEVKYINFDGDSKFGEIEVNKLIADRTTKVFDELYKRKFPIYNISKANGRTDEDIILVNDTTGYNFRTVLGTDRLSNHAFGMAIDINPKNNPAKPSKMSHVYDESIKDGILTSDIIEMIKGHGFKWGGEIFGNFWDSHHFEVDMNIKNKMIKKLWEN